MILVGAVVEVAVGKVQEEIVKSLLHLFDLKGESMRLFDFIIQKEVEKTSESSYLSSELQLSYY